MWAHNLSVLDYIAFLVFCCCLLATVLRIGFAVVMHYAGDWIARTFTTNAPFPLYIASRIIKVGSELTLESKTAVRVILACCWFSLGYMTSQMQLENNTDRFRIKVDRVDGPYRYYVHKDSEPPWLLKICEDIGDPGFDEGDWVDLTVLKTGPCMSLHQPYGFVAVPGHAKNRNITFKETE